MHEQQLKDVGLKITAPRLKILGLLHDKHQHHWSAEAMHQYFLEHNEDIGLATVYRVLTQFEMCGLVTRHHFEDDRSVFELNHSEHHDHLVCLECGRVEEFVDEDIEKRQKEIAKRLGYKMKDHRLIIYGVCKKCQ